MGRSGERFNGEGDILWTLSRIKHAFQEVNTSLDKVFIIHCIMRIETIQNDSYDLRATNTFDTNKDLLNAHSILNNLISLQIKRFMNTSLSTISHAKSNATKSENDQEMHQS